MDRMVPIYSTTTSLSCIKQAFSTLKCELKITIYAIVYELPKSFKQKRLLKE